MNLVIVTCDKYSFCVPICIKFLKRAGMPYPITVMTNTLPIDYPDTVYVGTDMSWSSNLLKFLQGKEEPFILWLENCICDSINLPLLERAVEAIKNPDVGMIRLLPAPGPTGYYNMDIGEIDKQLPNAVSCQVSIWKPKTLRDMLREGESAWDFELCGSMRAMEYTKKKFLGTYGYAVRYSDYIVHREGMDKALPGMIDPNVQAWIDKCEKEST